MLNLRFAWESYLAWGQQVEEEADHFLFHQQENGKGFYYLRKGEIKLTLLSPEGIERTVYYVPEGMLFGEDGLNNKPYLTTACTVHPSTLYFFSDTIFKKITQTSPAAIAIFTNSLLYKYRILAEIISFMPSPVEQQIAHFLIKIIKEIGSKQFNQTTFAQYIGVSRITINKVLNKWRKNEIIDFIDNEIIITDLQRLKAIQYSKANLPYKLDYLLLSS